MNFKIISKSDLLPRIWDGGKTYEYFISPADSSYSNRDFDFRISSASIEKTPSNFTRFEAYQRYLVMLDGDLKINRNGKEDNYAQHEIFEFDSNDEIQSFSIGNDFNLMVRNGENPFEIKVQMLSSVYQKSWMFVFAIAETRLKINQQEIKMNANDLLVLENDQIESITFESDLEVIFGSLISFNIQ